MSTTRLTFSDLSFTPGGVLIGTIKVIDSQSGETLRIANQTPELLQFLESIEVDLDKWHAVEKMKEKNSNLKVMIDTLRLFT